MTTPKRFGGQPSLPIEGLTAHRGQWLGGFWCSALPSIETLSPLSSDGMVDAFVTRAFHGAISNLEDSNLRQNREVDVMDRSFPPAVSERQCWKHELVRSNRP
ncbi:hypothetical protein KR52_07690 [Synechococcus sp. KORDI-52]|uniref:hypothetical protein n=1 Tax=Synechococcus sp. KORDI-52 TaxID=585425 RepID=UPI0004E05F5E|nr:hypothetical protein [Synechococcus sp. KORDI-52]AII49022.1 hypothetical protein KR52_07690 [Synechococcus sp. KORDI-52]